MTSRSSTTITVQNFTGKVFALSVDSSSQVSDVKEAAALSLGKTPAALAYKGHELRDHRPLSHYGVVNGDLLHIREA